MLMSIRQHVSTTTKKQHIRAMVGAEAAVLLVTSVSGKIFFGLTFIFLAETKWH